MKCKQCKVKTASADGFCKKCDPAPKGTFRKTHTARATVVRTANA